MICEQNTGAISKDVNQYNVNQFDNKFFIGTNYTTYETESTDEDYGCPPVVEGIATGFHFGLADCVCSAC